MRSDSSLVVRNPGELIAAVPYVMGYHPHDNVALLGLRGNELAFGACFDLPPPDRDDAFIRAVVEEVAAAIARQEPESVVIVGYGTPQQVTPVVLVVTEALRSAGLRVDDVMRVCDGRWWSYLCDEPRCCPPEGKPCLPPDSVIAAEATYLGQVALPSRKDLVAQVAPVQGPAREAMAAATGRARRRFTELLDSGDDRVATKRIRQAGRLAVREAEKRYRSGAALTDDEAAWLGVLLTDRVLEDYALDRTGPHEWQIGLWTDVLRRVEQVHVPAPACLLAFVAWRLGLGPLARVAVDRALKAEPGHHLAGMLHELLGFGLSPGMLKRGVR